MQYCQCHFGEDLKLVHSTTLYNKNDLDKKITGQHEEHSFLIFKWESCTETPLDYDGSCTTTRDDDKVSLKNGEITTTTRDNEIAIDKTMTTTRDAEIRLEDRGT